MTLESKQRLYGSVFRLKPLTECFYTEHLSMASLLLGDVPPSHHDAEDISAKRLVYKCKPSDIEAVQDWTECETLGYRSLADHFNKHAFGLRASINRLCCIFFLLFASFNPIRAL